MARHCNLVLNNLLQLRLGTELAARCDCLSSAFAVTWTSLADAVAVAILAIPIYATPV